MSRLLADGHDPMAVRLAILAHHYRHDWDWTAAGLAAAGDRLARWREAVRVAPAASLPAAETMLAAVRERLADDLDAPGALAAVDSWAGAVPGASATGASATGASSAGASRPGGDPASAAGELVRDTVDALLGIIV